MTVVKNAALPKKAVSKKQKKDVVEKVKPSVEEQQYRAHLWGHYEFGQPHPGPPPSSTGNI